MEEGLGFLEPLLSYLPYFLPCRGSGLRLWGLWKHLRVSWFLCQQAVCGGAQPFLQFRLQTSPLSSPEEGWVRVPVWPCPEGSPGLPRQEQPPSPSVSCKTPFPMHLLILPIHSQRLWQSQKMPRALSFFPANADTWLYLSRFSISFSEKSSEPCTSLSSQRRLGREGKVLSHHGKS